jgi:hypothetical protein
MFYNTGNSNTVISLANDSSFFYLSNATTIGMFFDAKIKDMPYLRGNTTDSRLMFAFSYMPIDMAYHKLFPILSGCKRMDFAFYNFNCSNAEQAKSLSLSIGGSALEEVPICMFWNDWEYGSTYFEQQVPQYSQVTITKVPNNLKNKDWRQITNYLQNIQIVFSDQTTLKVSYEPETKSVIQTWL